MHRGLSVGWRWAEGKENDTLGEVAFCHIPLDFPSADMITLVDR